MPGHSAENETTLEHPGLGTSTWLAMFGCVNFPERHKNVFTRFLVMGLFCLPAFLFAGE